MTRFTKIVIDKKEEAKFRRRALRKFPNEYVEMLWGYVEKRILYVCAFVPVDHKAWINMCEYQDEDVEEHVERAREHHKLRVVGTIHTHPYRDDAIASDTDYRDSEEATDLVMGVMSIVLKKGRKKVTELCYWHPHALRPVYTDHS